MHVFCEVVSGGGERLWSEKKLYTGISSLSTFLVITLHTVLLMCFNPVYPFPVGIKSTSLYPFHVWHFMGTM